MKIPLSFFLGLIAFTSTSSDRAFPGNISFVIKSKTGRLIAPISANEDENEVLFAPNTKFKILNIEMKDKIDKYDDEESKKEKRKNLKISMEELP